MTATERLRQLLDERGVVWGNRFAGEPQSSYTRYEVDSGMSVTAWEDTITGKLGLSVEIDYRLTPEQAVDATLGRGTCRIDYHFGEWYCTGCGEMVGTHDPSSELCIDGNAIELWNYCPNCGRKVEP